jgi:hypothetical protein
MNDLIYNFEPPALGNAGKALRGLIATMPRTTRCRLSLARSLYDALWRCPSLCGWPSDDRPPHQEDHYRPSCLRGLVRELRHLSGASLAVDGMKSGAACRHRRAAFAAIRRVIMDKQKPRELIHVAAWREMQKAAEEFYPPREPPRQDMRTASELPVCGGAGHEGAI